MTGKRKAGSYTNSSCSWSEINSVKCEFYRIFYMHENAKEGTQGIQKG